MVLHYKESGDRNAPLMLFLPIEIVASNPNCKGVIIPHIGHGITLAKPEYFNQLIEDWLDKGSVPIGVKLIG